jgi:sterol desaturase/sphingolipid hydroxylase (fatty acid hydroxylase superfamily)
VTEFIIEGLRPRGIRRRRIIIPGLVGLLFAAPVLLAISLNFLAPDHLAVSLFGQTLTIARVRQGAIARLSFLAGALSCLALAEAVVVGWRDSSLRRVLRRPSPSVRTDIVVFLTQHCKVAIVLQFAATFGVVALLTRYANLVPSLPAIRVIGLCHWPPVAQFLVVYGFYTFADYWAHRLSHAPIVWPVHRFHHAADDFCILTHARIHAAEVFGVVIVNLPIVMLRPSPAVLAVVWSLVIYLRMAIHSRLPWRMGWLGATLVQSPAHHRLHHRLDEGEGASNYALCPLWDRLFGTWRAEVPANFAIGVHEPYRHGAWFLPDFIRDYVAVFAGLAGRGSRERFRSAAVRR